jgi:hypothetical protein
MVPIKSTAPAEDGLKAGGNRKKKGRAKPAEITWANKRESCGFPSFWSLKHTE